MHACRISHGDPLPVRRVLNIDGRAVVVDYGQERNFFGRFGNRIDSRAGLVANHETLSIRLNRNRTWMVCRQRRNPAVVNSVDNLDVARVLRYREHSAIRAEREGRIWRLELHFVWTSFTLVC